MRKILSLVLALVASTSMFATEGALNGRFTINEDGDQIFFSQGNLQYVGSWQFATNQWDTLGAAQSDDHRDLFGWGTGDAPNKISTDYVDYLTYTEWGDNPITNGGNTAKEWRTLTKEEWAYLFKTRENAATLFALGSVNGVNGTILLPDNWVTPEGASFTASTTLGMVLAGIEYYDENGGHFADNTYTTEQWAVMESAGAVFLPAAGYRVGTDVYETGSAGLYWSATYLENRYSYNLLFNEYELVPTNISIGMNGIFYGISVRLVKIVDTTPIENVGVTNAVSKTFHDGVLLIEKNGKFYNATGAEVR